MQIIQSAGLTKQLNTVAVYAQRYPEFVKHVLASTYAQLCEAYPAEHASWRNRKWTAKRRGIEWHPSLNSFKDFLLTCGPMPSPGMTLDRINFIGGYTPSNIQWATRTD